MKFKVLAVLAVCVALGAFSTDATAGGRDPGSLLIFPFYNTAATDLTVITITNTCNKDVVVRLVWVDEVSCSPEDQWIELTGYDTFSFTANAMNPQIERGFLYAYVVENYGDKHGITGTDWECLIGQELIFSAWLPAAVVNYGINAVPFNAVGGDANADGILELDGAEWEMAPRELLFPRFFGQDGTFTSDMMLINLTGGKRYAGEWDILVYNDNEQAWSTTFSMPTCYWYGPLAQVSAATTEAWLLASNHNPDELMDSIAGPNKKTGWMHFVHDYAYNYVIPGYADLDDGAGYGVLVETVGGISAADLPFQIIGTQLNYGSLWPTM